MLINENDTTVDTTKIALAQYITPKITILIHIICILYAMVKVWASPSNLLPMALFILIESILIVIITYFLIRLEARLRGTQLGTLQEWITSKAIEMNKIEHNENEETETKENSNKQEGK